MPAAAGILPRMVALRRTALLAALICAAVGAAFADGIPVATTETGVTIATTGTFQQALAAGSTLPAGKRNSCTIQYTGNNIGYVFFGPTASATLATSFQLTNKQIITCPVGGVVLNDAVQVTGTTNDTFVVAQQ